MDGEAETEGGEEEQATPGGVIILPHLEPRVYHYDLPAAPSAAPPAAPPTAPTPAEEKKKKKQEKEAADGAADDGRGKSSSFGKSLGLSSLKAATNAVIGQVICAELRAASYFAHHHYPSPNS